MELGAKCSPSKWERVDETTEEWIDGRTDVYKPDREKISIYSLVWFKFRINWRSPENNKNHISWYHLKFTTIGHIYLMMMMVIVTTTIILLSLSMNIVVTAIHDHGHWRCGVQIAFLLLIRIARNAKSEKNWPKSLDHREVSSGITLVTSPSIAIENIYEGLALSSTRLRLGLPVRLSLRCISPVTKSLMKSRNTQRKSTKCPHKERKYWQTVSTYVRIAKAYGMLFMLRVLL